MKIAIITSGFLPVPSTKGGAVEQLINILLDKNEIYKKMEFNIFSVFEQEAYNKSKQYSNSKFCFLKVNKFVKILDEILYWFMKIILKKKNSHSYKFVFQRINYLMQVSKLLKENEYDCVILENHPTQYLALKWNNNYKKYKNRYYYHCHNDINNTYGCENLLNDTKKIITISEYISANLLNLYKGIQDKNIFLLKNCIEIDKIQNDVNIDNIKEKYKIDKNKKLIIYVGRLVEEKGILQLVKSLDFLKTKDFQLVIAGGSISKINAETVFVNELKKETEKHKDKIIFIGYVEHNDIYQLYKVADVVVLPSIWNEPAGLTMLEAMASNVPLITTDVGGIREYINKDAAILLKNDEELIENIAKNIDLIFKDNKLKEKLSKNGYNYAQIYNSDRYYNEFWEIVKKEEIH